MAKSNSARGTVAPVVLGANTAQQYWLNDMDRRKQIEEQTQQREAQNTDKTNQKFAQDLTGLSELATSGLYTQELTDITNKLVQEGGKFLAAGVDPYRPQSDLSPASRQAVMDFQKDLNKTKIIKATLDKVQASKEGLLKEYAKDPSSYDIDQFKEVKDFENKYSLDDIASGKFEMPQLGKILDRTQFNSSVPELSNTDQVQTTDAQGNIQTQQVKAPAMDRITAETNRQFTKGSEWANETERLLGKAGFAKDINGVLGTTDTDTIRETIDAQLKSPTEGNPMVALMANKKIPSFDSPEYQSFLDNAVAEQLRAEKIVANEKQYVMDAYINKVNPVRGEKKYDFALENQNLKRQAAARAARQADATLKYTKSRINKLENGSSEDDNLLSQTMDVDFDITDDKGDITGTISAFNTVPMSSSPISINPSQAINTRTGQKEKLKESRGNITGVGVVAYDKNGNVVQGSVNDLSKREGITFKPTVLMQYGSDKRKKTAFYNPSDIATKGMPKATQKLFNEALGLSKKISKEQNAKKKESDTSSINKTIDPLTLENKESKYTPKLEKITW